MKYALALAVLLSSVPTMALASADPVADTRQILAGTVTKGGATYKAYLSGAKDNTTAFKGALAAYKAVRAAEQPVIVPPAPTPLAMGDMVRLSSALPQCLLPLSIIPKQGVAYRLIAFGDTVPTPTRQFAELGPFEGATYWVYTDCLTK